ncbi:hypothetical protein [Roseovarius sp. ZX-A-9]|uniref:hypothetical protein n=1 Tax=Roseovarius sp. ZX-A-9 TaxID=3014783 RepID=UPI00233142C6|nr:hypothetical protein [Roseovarius sp. ZX-A-9]
MRYIFSMTAVLLATGCGTLGLDGQLRRSETAESAPVTANTPTAETLRPEARPAAAGTFSGGTAQTAEALDTTSAAEKAAAQAASGGRDLGVTIASLGAPAEPGFWLKTPLVREPGKGRVRHGATGKSVQVDLIPIDGPKTAGSRLSLAAMRLLGVPLTSLPELRVYQTSP